MASLNGTLPETIEAFNKLAAIGASHGISIGVADYGGLRSQSDTTRILGYRQDDYNAAIRAGEIKPDTTLQQFRPINPFGKSWHNYGGAFDVLIVARPSGMSEYDAKKYLGQFAPSLGLRWGGLFANPDPPHFELAIPLDELKRRYAANSGGGGSGGSGGNTAVPLSLLNLVAPPLGELATDYAIDVDPFAGEINFADVGGADLVYDETNVDGGPNVWLIGGGLLVLAGLLYFRQRV